MGTKSRLANDCIMGVAILYTSANIQGTIATAVTRIERSD